MKACTIIGAICAIFMALPFILEYSGKALAPWTSMPQKLDRIEIKVDRISTRLNIVTVPGAITNTNIQYANEH